MKAWQKTVIAAGLLVMAASCRNEPDSEKPKIEKIIFEESVKNIYVGDTVKVNVAAEPKEAKEHDKITYRASESGIIEIKGDSGNDGVVFEGIKRGKTVITASANGVVDYCNVNVLGGSENVIPHIIVPDYVIECRENERRSIVASLAGGTPLDDGGFIWSCSNQKVISLESTGNIGVFDTLNTGESVVTISHPKAQFGVNVLIYVIGNDETPVYITTDNNVVAMNTSDSNYQYSVDLRGGDSGDYYAFRHELLDGGDVIELRANNNIGTINPITKGVARIGISHPKAAYRMEIVVIVNEKMEYTYIDIDKTLIIMEEGLNEVLKADMIGDAPPDYIDKYAFENENSDVIDVQQSHDNFRITALQRGRSVITIKNEYADFDREVLVIVNGIGGIQDNEVYITTNQNVITTEIGGDDVLLTMTLVGGNEADRNNFVWTVDDGSIISVESAHGAVQYKNRSAAGNTGDKFEAQAIIKAKKVGTAKITLENPKAKNSFSVIVKVYKKGVFGVIPIVIDGPSIHKVNIGEKLPVFLRVVAGSGQNFTNAAWSSDNNDIVSASGAGLTGMLEGKAAGITTVTVSGDNLKHDYTATIIVGDDEYLEHMPLMYVLHPFISIVKGESAAFRIVCENMSAEEISGINVVNNSGDVMEVFAYKNSVMVTGIALGEGEIIISASGLNTIQVMVTVEDYNLTPDTPYYLRTDAFIYGVVKGRNLEISVDLIGGSAANERNILWAIEDSNVALISGNGKKCVITGRNAGQTVITAAHVQSYNKSIEIVIYVVEKESELNSKIVMRAKEANILLAIGETRYVSIITNANDAQKNNFQWDISNASVIDVGVSGDRVKAYINAKNAGNAAITVRSGDQMPVVIYVSVINSAYNAAYINVPSIVEMAAGQTMSINAVTNNVYDKMNITWSVKDGNIAVIHENGGACLVTALKSGKTIITVEYKPAGFVKDIALYVYASADEAASRYILAGEQSRYVINVGDIVNINLVFGMKGYPDYELHNIWWRTDDAAIIDVTGNGKSAGIKGLNPGIGIVTVSDHYENDIKIEVEVRERGKAGQYWFSIRAEDRIKGILAGNFADIEVKVFNGSNEVFNVGGIEYEVEHGDIISVAANENGIRVFAAAGREGQSYITVKHDSVEDARILIYTALSEYGLESAYPILVEKTNYLIQKGESIAITAETRDNDNAKLRNISYGLERNNGVISISERNKREIEVNANNVGSDVILVRYNAAVVQRIYVSVTEGNYGQNAGYMITESIIVMLKDTEYETRIDTNIEYDIRWRAQANYVIDIVSSSTKTALIKGNIVGETTLTVNGDGLERVIAVFVCANEEEMRRYQAINIDQRKYRMRKNESITVNIHSYQGRVEGETRYGDYFNCGSPYGNVIAVNAVENGKFSIKGINEGIAAIRVTNEFYMTEMIIYIDVFPADEGNTGIVDRQYYISAGKTLYVIGENERDIVASVHVMGDGFFGDAYWIWSGFDESIISVNSMGRDAVVNPIQKGETKITVSNRDCANSLEITVIVGDRFVVDDSPLSHIYVEKNLYEISKDSGSISISYSIVNVVNVIARNIGYEIYGNAISVSHDAAHNVFTVAPRETGIGRFDITYGDLRREVYVLVKENMDSGSVYLTTSENYAVVSIGEVRAVNVQLAGYDELDSRNFEWSVDKQGIIQLAANGTAAQIYGIRDGDVVITVTHLREGKQKAKNSLKINVKVVKDKVKEKVVYLTTQRNVIETVVGAAGERIYVQKVGGDITKTRTTWTVSHPNIVSLTENQGYDAQYEAKNEGIARITVRNVEANYDLEIVIIVRAALNNGIYISTGENLLILAPGEQKKISATLVNGDVKDNNRFEWSIRNAIPSDPNVVRAGGGVISIVGSSEQCSINAINEGTAFIEVWNRGRAELPLVITVYVSHFKEIGFSLSNKEIVVGESEFIGLNLPTYEYLKDKARVWAEDENGNPSSVCDVFYSNTLVLVSGKKPGFAVIKAVLEGKEGQARMLVTVAEKADPNVNRMIVGKNVYVISPSTKAFVLNAAVSGPNIFDSDFENIYWDVRLNDKAGGKDIIDIIPKNASGDESVRYAQQGRRVVARGRSIQLTPKELGTAVITVSHPYVTEDHFKQISIIVADSGNLFSINKKEITVNSLRPETVTAQITGGTTRDYEEIKWIARMQQKWDGTMLEIVRIMGSGREVTLYPMNDGETEVLAIYKNYSIPIKIAVVSDYLFSFRTSNEYMWPGERRDLPFDVKPASSSIHWVNGNANPNEEPVVTYGEVMGSSPGGTGSVNRYLQIEAQREGTATITGMANGKVASVTVIVQYDYSFVLEGTLAAVPSSMPKHSSASSSADGVRYATYTVHPANTYIRPVSNKPGLEIEVLPPVEMRNGKGQTVGTGKIKFTGLKEMNEMVQFQQYKPMAPGSDKEVPVEGTERQPSSRSINVMYYFPETIKPIPYFIRGDGKYSNIDGESDESETAAPVAMGSYKLKKDNRVQGEQIAQNAADGSYSLTLGDGEVHYILFDKKYDVAELNISNINSQSLGVLNGSNFTADIVDLQIDGITRKAIRLSGGADYIEYNRVAYNQKLFLYVKSDAYDDRNSVVETRMEEMYDDVHYVTVRNLKLRLVGEWYDVKDSGLDKKKYYILTKKIIELNDISTETIDNYCGKSVILAPEFCEYWNNSEYQYYFTGDETNEMESKYKRTFQEFLDKNCITRSIGTPEYYYDWIAFANNIDVLGSKIRSNHIEYREYNGWQPIGGYMTSLYGLNNRPNIYAVYTDHIVYEYDKEKIIDLVRDGITLPFSVTYNAWTRVFEGWDPGEFNNSFITPLGENYRATSLYSTNEYLMNVMDIRMGDFRETKYDVFENKYINSFTDEVITGTVNGVYLFNSGVSTSYSSGTLTSTEFHGCDVSKRYWEYFSYENMKLNPYYSIVGGVQTTSKNNYMQIYDNNKGKSKSRKKVVTKTTVNPNTGKVNTVYGYVDFPSESDTGAVKGNRMGGNIFATYSSNGRTRYGTYGPFYYATTRSWSHNTWPGTNDCFDLDHNFSYRSFYSDSRAQQKLQWEGSKKVIVPYFFFNRFPYRYERSAEIPATTVTATVNAVRLSDGGGRPMPSLARNQKDTAEKELLINYKTFDIGDPQGKSAYLKININMRVRPCHSQYIGLNYDDSYVNSNNTDQEMEGVITNYNDSNADYKNPNIMKFLE